MRRFIAAGFGVGWIPRRLWGSDNGAGTFGAALAALAGLVLWHLPVWVGVAAAAGAVLLSLWAAAPFATDGQDPGWVVVDEIAGTLCALIGLTAWPWVAALVVARLADIFKVLPGVAAAERLPGAVGVTFDDVLAGGYGLAVGWLLVALL
jgi:phosphatidylglycerophosphatase A